MIEVFIITPDSNKNEPPLPVLAYNPVIDNIVVDYNGHSSTGTWLLDTGGMISIVSAQQANKLGLVDANGEPLVTPDFVSNIGGVGGTVEIPGFQLDSLRVPTLSGFDIVYKNPRE